MFLKNLDYTSRAELYKFQFAKAAELMDWKKTGIRAAIPAAVR